MSVEFWIGQGFDASHEHRALARFLSDIDARLGKDGKRYFVLANFRVHGSAVDLTILKRDAIIVVELKEFGQPFRATENGPWQSVPPGRGVVGLGDENPLEQVDRYRRKWADFLRERKHEFLSPARASRRKFDLGSVDCFACISPKIHPDSRDETSHLKWFRLVGLDQLANTIQTHKGHLDLTEDELGRIITALNLRKGDLSKAGILVDTAPRYNPFFGPPPVATTLVGRDHECALLDQYTHQKSVRVINIRGPEGSGRSELAAWLGGRLSDDGWRIKWLYCRQRELTLDNLLAALADETPDTIRAGYIRDTAQARADRFQAASSVLDEQPTLLVLDDFDAATRPEQLRDFLAFIARHAKQVRVVLTTLTRPAILDEPVWNLKAIQEIGLGGLPRESAAAVLGDEIARKLSPAQLRAIWEEAGGIPYAMRILAHSQLSAPTKKVAASLLRQDEDWSTRFRALLQTLTEAERHLVYQLSVVRGAFGPELIRRLSQLEDRRVQQITAALLAHHILKQSANSLEMYELVRQFAYAESPAKTKRSADATVGSYYSEKAERAQRDLERLDYLLKAIWHFDKVARNNKVEALAADASEHFYPTVSRLFGNAMIAILPDDAHDYRFAPSEPGAISLEGSLVS